MIFVLNKRNHRVSLNCEGYCA